MPIYAYKCESCGTAKDVLQKISDPALTVCPACGQPTFHKQVTAAGFQLKGNGWYVTDFRGGGSGAGAGAAAGAASASEKKADTTSESASSPAASSHGCGAQCSCG